MRISDWSSDVCSSDLSCRLRRGGSALRAGCLGSRVDVCLQVGRQVPGGLHVVVGGLARGQHLHHRDERAADGCPHYGFPDDHVRVCGVARRLLARGGLPAAVDRLLRDCRTAPGRDERVNPPCLRTGCHLFLLWVDGTNTSGSWSAPVQPPTPWGAAWRSASTAWGRGRPRSTPAPKI